MTAAPDVPASAPTRLLYGHAGGASRARTLAELEGVFLLPELGDVIVVDPLGVLRLMSAGDGYARQSGGRLEVYFDQGASTVELWPCFSPCRARPVELTP